MNDNDLKNKIKDEFSIDDESMLEEEGFLKISKILRKKGNFKLVFGPKLVYVFTLIIAICLVFPFLSNNNNPNNSNQPHDEIPNDEIPNDEEPNDDNSDVNDYLLSNDIAYTIYKAATTSLSKNERKGLRKLNSSAEDVIDINKISYPFDYLRVTNPYKFDFYIPDDSYSYAEQRVGTGLIEVILCAVDFYIEEDGILNLTISDHCIILKGELGIVFCLMNSGGVVYNQPYYYEFEYSTHKFFDNEEVIKDFEKENTSIYVTLYSPNYDFGFNLGEPKKIKLDSGEYYPVNGSYKSVQVSDVYKVGEIQKPDLKTIEVVLKEYFINDMIFEPIEGQNLQKGIVDSSTKILFEDGSEATHHAMFFGNQKLQISYAYLYEGYNPKVVYIDEIIILNTELIYLDAKIIKLENSVFLIEPIEGYLLNSIFINGETLIENSDGTIATINDLMYENLLITFAYRKYNDIDLYHFIPKHIIIKGIDDNNLEDEQNQVIIEENK